MNIKKTNPKGLYLINRDHVLFNSVINCSKNKNNGDDKEFFEQYKINDKNFNDLNEISEKEGVFLDRKLVKGNKSNKIFRVTKKIRESANLINFDTIIKNVKVNDVLFDNVYILMENDEEGFLHVCRTGSDLTFFYLKNLSTNFKAILGSFSFLTKEFGFVSGENKYSQFVIKLLVYLSFGEITTKIIKTKNVLKTSSFTKFINNSKHDITFIDSLWSQRIKTDGFKVRGHFRLQPFGENLLKNKLIWIEEFAKEGYNRKATKELIKENKNGR